MRNEKIATNLDTLQRKMLDSSLLDWLALYSHLYHTDRHCSRAFLIVQILDRRLKFLLPRASCAARAHSIRGLVKPPKFLNAGLTRSACCSACACVTPNFCLSGEVRRSSLLRSTTRRSMPVEIQHILADGEDDPPLSRLQHKLFLDYANTRQKYHRSLSLNFWGVLDRQE